MQNCKSDKVFEQNNIAEQMKTLEIKYSCFGENDVSIFYENYKKYEKLKNKGGLFCIVCGISDFIGETPDDLYDAIGFQPS